MSVQYLYRLWSADDELLYVGISASALQRLSQHQKDKAWASQISKVTLETYPSREAVERAEREAIATENPRYNIRRYSDIAYSNVDDLWHLAGPSERRLVGAVLASIGYSLHESDEDRTCLARDDDYMSVGQLLVMVGRWFTDDTRPDAVVASLVNYSRQVRDEARTVTARWYEDYQQHESMRQINRDLRSEVANLKKQLKANLTAIPEAVSA